MGCSDLVGIQLVTASSESPGINAAGGKSWHLAIQVLEAPYDAVLTVSVHSDQ